MDTFKWFVGKDVQTDISVPFDVKISGLQTPAILKYGLKYMRTESIQLGHQKIIRMHYCASTQTNPMHSFSYQGVLSMKLVPSVFQVDSRISINMKKGVRHSMLKTIQ